MTTMVRRTTVGLVGAAVLLWAGISHPQSCSGDFNGDNQVTVDEILTAVNNALNGCPVQRFVDNGDGTISDTQTGLMWEKKQNPGGPSADPHNVNNQYAWTSTGTAPDGPVFTDFLDNLNNHCSKAAGLACTGNADCALANGGPGGPCGFAGFRDWRLPEVNQAGGRGEWESIIDLTAPGCGRGGGPCIALIFGPTASSSYWSSTTEAEGPMFAWLVNFFDGNVAFAGLKTNLEYARAVRGSL